MSSQKRVCPSGCCFVLMPQRRRQTLHDRTSPTRLAHDCRARVPRHRCCNTRAIAFHVNKDVHVNKDDGWSKPKATEHRPRKACLAFQTTERDSIRSRAAGSRKTPASWRTNAHRSKCLTQRIAQVNTRCPQHSVASEVSGVRKPSKVHGEQRHGGKVLTGGRSPSLPGRSKRRPSHSACRAPCRNSDHP